MSEETPVVPTDESGGQEKAVNNEVIETGESAPPVEVIDGEESPEGEQQTEVETEGDEDIPDTPENKGIRKRINKLNTKAGDAEQRAVDAEFELAKIRKDQEVVINSTTPAPIQARPQESEFETYEAYEDALMGWNIDRKDAAKNAQSQKDTLERQQFEASRNFDRRSEEIKVSNPDFEEVAKSPAMLDFYEHNPMVRELIESSDVGPEIALHFGKNKNVAANIAAMPMLQAAKEIGKLEIKLSTTPKPKAVSKAPSPITPIKGGGSISTDEDDPLGDNLSTKEWMKREDAKTAKR